jgi:peptidoglycan/LPS O-acetylase OafA/YrhL
VLRSRTWLNRATEQLPPQGLTSPQHGDALPHPRTEILALTGIRAVAAIAVVLHHIRLPHTAPTALKQIIDAGYIGVPLFFMLSGLVLGWNYSTLSPHDGSKLKRFYLARVARVMPLYWVVLFYLVLMRAARDIPQDNLWRHVLAIQSWSGDWQIGQQAYNAPGWSICVEVFLYALFPFLVPVIAAIARRYRTTGLLVVIAVAWAIQLALVTFFTAKGWAVLHAREPNSGHRWLYRNPLTRVPDFVVGISLAFLLMRGIRLRVRNANILQAVIVVFVLVLAALPRESGLLRAMFYGAMWTVPFGLLLLSLAAQPRALLSRFLSTRMMVALGTASYALYLTHRPILPNLGQNLVDRPGINPYLVVLVILGLCLLIAEGAHRFVEVPCRKAILRLVGGRGVKPSTPPDTGDQSVGPEPGSAPAAATARTSFSGVRS